MQDRLLEDNPPRRPLAIPFCGNSDHAETFFRCFFPAAGSFLYRGEIASQIT